MSNQWECAAARIRRYFHVVVQEIRNFATLIWKIGRRILRHSTRAGHESEEDINDCESQFSAIEVRDILTIPYVSVEDELNIDSEYLFEESKLQAEKPEATKVSVAVRESGDNDEESNFSDDDQRFDDEMSPSVPLPTARVTYVDTYVQTNEDTRQSTLVHEKMGPTDEDDKITLENIAIEVDSMPSDSSSDSSSLFESKASHFRQPSSVPCGEYKPSLHPAQNSDVLLHSSSEQFHETEYENSTSDWSEDNIHGSITSSSTSTSSMTLDISALEARIAELSDSIHYDQFPVALSPVQGETQESLTFVQGDVSLLPSTELDVRGQSLLNNVNNVFPSSLSHETQWTGETRRQQLSTTAVVFKRRRGVETKDKYTIFEKNQTLVSVCNVIFGKRGRFLYEYADCMPSDLHRAEFWLFTPSVWHKASLVRPEDFECFEGHPSSLRLEWSRGFLYDTRNVFDRFQYRMDDRIDSELCKKGCLAFPTERVKVKRRGVPNKHLINKNKYEYLEEEEEEMVEGAAEDESEEIGNEFKEEEMKEDLRHYEGMSVLAKGKKSQDDIEQQYAVTSDKKKNKNRKKVKTKTNKTKVKTLLKFY